MNLLELSPRLRTVAEQVPLGARLVDVGTDHGFLPAWLLQRGLIAEAIASELRAQPLENAKRTATRLGLDTMSFCQSNGLDGVEPHQVDTVTIAGMGGETIVSILAGAPWVCQEGYTVILQPQSSLPELRTWLQSHGFAIQRELVGMDNGRWFTVMVVAAGTMAPLTFGEQWAGVQYQGMDSPLRSEFLPYLLHRVRRALDGLQRAESDRDVARGDYLHQVVCDLVAMEKEWNLWQQS